MTLRRMMLGLAALATLGATPALATPPDLSTRQLQVKQALTVFDLGLTGDRFSQTTDGRRKDLVLVSSQTRAEVLSALKTAYSEEKTLPNGYRVAGWAHLVQTDSTTFTLKNDVGDRMVAEVFDEGGATKVKVWGVMRKDKPDVLPFDARPRRFSPGR